MVFWTVYVKWVFVTWIFLEMFGICQFGMVIWWDLWVQQTDDPAFRYIQECWGYIWKDVYKLTLIWGECKSADNILETIWVCSWQALEVSGNAEGQGWINIFIWNTASTPWTWSDLLIVKWFWYLQVQFVFTSMYQHINVSMYKSIYKQSILTGYTMSVRAIRGIPQPNDWVNIQIQLEIHMEAKMKWMWRETWWTRLSKLRQALGSCYHVNLVLYLEMMIVGPWRYNLEVVMVQLWRYTWRSSSWELSHVLGVQDRVNIERYLEAAIMWI